VVTERAVSRVKLRAVGSWNCWKWSLIFKLSSGTPPPPKSVQRRRKKTSIHFLSAPISFSSRHK
jgi:hypothetical protein